MRIHRYHPTLPEEGDDVVGLEAHADTSAVTILYQDGSKYLFGSFTLSCAMDSQLIA
jgi:isopenicillin N synthase-like dioxygenase